MERIYLTNVKEFSYSKKESLRAIRTNIQFSGDDIKSILITSAVPNEGKSTVTFDLARSLCDAGKKVLLIDTDMRKSVLVGRLKAAVSASEKKELKGLSHLLSGQAQVDEVIYETDISRLYMIFAGPSVPNPTEILEKKYFENLMAVARTQFDYVLMDCAPLSAAIDSAVIAKHCDGAILVIGQDQANTKIIAAAKNQLETAGVNIIGAILNKVKMEKNHYGKYYGKYYGSYYGSYYGNYGDRD